MKKLILITGATDGIGLEAARILLEAGHRVLLHGRSAEKLARVSAELAESGAVEGSFVADLSSMEAVERLADEVAELFDGLDVLINNAGVYSTPVTETADGLDVRFAVNTFAPYVLTKRLLPLLGTSGRVINLSSAAQAPVDLEALVGRKRLADGAAYAQSKLAITMWSLVLAEEYGPGGTVVIPVNPGSMLGSKMVKEAFAVSGGDVKVGGEILARLATDESFASDSGRYYDNDRRRFGDPHSDALDEVKCGEVVEAMDRWFVRRGE